MADLFRTCRDGHRCEHGALCIEAQEGSYYCDCDTAPNGNFAGLSCEFEAETYCRLPQDTTSSWFCTNQGTCVFGSGNSGQSNWKCDCPAEYDGPHCEFIKGARPDDWPTLEPFGSSGNTISSGRDGLEIGVMVTITLVSILVGAMLALMVFRSIQKRNSKQGMEHASSFRNAGQNAPKDHSEALNIDMDGTGFRDSVLGSGKTNGTEQFDFDSHGVSVEVGSDLNGSVSPRNGISSKTNGTNGTGHGHML